MLRKTAAPAGGLCRTLPLLGELEPLVRQLFVAAFAFLVPTVRNQVQAVCWARSGFVGRRAHASAPGPASAGRGIHGDLLCARIPPMVRNLARSVHSRCDCRHKNAFSPLARPFSSPAKKCLAQKGLAAGLSSLRKGAPWERGPGGAGLGSLGDLPLWLYLPRRRAGLTPPSRVAGRPCRRGSNSPPAVSPTSGSSNH
jgi:hypothetical protein